MHLYTSTVSVYLNKFIECPLSALRITGRMVFICPPGVESSVTSKWNPVLLTASKPVSLTGHDML